MAGTLGQRNPFRYRGYYYDTETGMYYLKSRYYDPGIRRFISADEISAMKSSMDSLHNRNMFSYCNSNPIIRKDGDGNTWQVALISAVAGFVFGASCSVGYQMIVEKKSLGELDMVDVASSGISGMIATTSWNWKIQAVANAALGGISSWIKGDDGVDIGINIVVGVIAGRIGGDGGNFGNNYNSYRQGINKLRKNPIYSSAYKDILGRRVVADHIKKPITTTTVRYGLSYATSKGIPKGAEYISLKSNKNNLVQMIPVSQYRQSNLRNVPSFEHILV